MELTEEIFERRPALWQGVYQTGADSTVYPRAARRESVLSGDLYYGSGRKCTGSRGYKSAFYDPEYLQAGVSDPCDP